MSGDNCTQKRPYYRLNELDTCRLINNKRFLAIHFEDENQFAISVIDLN